MRRGSIGAERSGGAGLHGSGTLRKILDGSKRREELKQTGRGEENLSSSLRAGSGKENKKQQELNLKRRGVKTSVPVEETFRAAASPSPKCKRWRPPEMVP